jgi:hypothetical protein
MDSIKQKQAIEYARKVRSYIQGEVLDAPDLCVVLASSKWPMREISEEAAQQYQGVADVVVVPDPVDHVVLVTQTCDLQRTDANNMLCQVAPLVDVNEKFAYEVMKGRRPGWAAVPWYSNSAAVDLSRITTVERSVIAEAPSLGRPKSQDQSSCFSEAVSRHFTRVALPDELVAVLKPFLEEIKKRHDRNTPLGSCIAKIPASGLRVEVAESDGSTHVLLLVVLEPQDFPELAHGVEVNQKIVDDFIREGETYAAERALNLNNPLCCRQGWLALTDIWRSLIIKVIEDNEYNMTCDVEVLSGYEMNFTRLCNSSELDLAYLSTRGDL